MTEEQFKNFTTWMSHFNLKLLNIELLDMVKVVLLMAILICVCGK